MPAVGRRHSPGNVRKLLHRFEPQAGDCLFLPAGTVHALGKGLLVAEIQQSSNTTFRLFDWNRVGPDGKPRPLHVEQGLAVVDFQRGPVDPQPQPTERPWVSRLVACDKFVMDRWEFDRPQAIGGDERFHIICVLQGAVRIEGDPHIESPLPKGGTAIIPACHGPVCLMPQQPTVLLDAYME